MSMIVRDLSQDDSPEWLDWRKGGVTATCAAVIMGENPDVTVWQLWAEKCGYRIPDDLSKNPFVLRGQRLEGKARLAAESHLSKHEGIHDILLPLCAEFSDNPIIRVSLDGSLTDHTPVELKCLSDTNVEDVRQNGANSKAYKLYWHQVQHQILVTESDHGWLGFYWTDESSGEDGILMFKIDRDDKYLDEYRVKAIKFWDSVLEKKEPEKDPKRDLFIPSGNQAAVWAHHASNYSTLDAEIKEVEKQLESLKTARKNHLDPLVNMMEEDGYFNSDFAGVQVTRFRVSGKVDWKSMAKDHISDANDKELKYTGPESMRCRATARADIIPRQVVLPEIVELAEESTANVVQAFF